MRFVNKCGVCSDVCQSCDELAQCMSTALLRIPAFLHPSILNLSHKPEQSSNHNPKLDFSNIFVSHRIALHSSPLLSLGIWQPSKPLIPGQ